MLCRCQYRLNLEKLAFKQRSSHLPYSSHVSFLVRGNKIFAWQGPIAALGVLCRNGCGSPPSSSPNFACSSPESAAHFHTGPAPGNRPPPQELPRVLSIQRRSARARRQYFARSALHFPAHIKSQLWFYAHRSTAAPLTPFSQPKGGARQNYTARRCSDIDWEQREILEGKQISVLR